MTLPSGLKAAMPSCDGKSPSSVVRSTFSCSMSQTSSRRFRGDQPDSPAKISFLPSGVNMYEPSPESTCAFCLPVATSQIPARRPLDTGKRFGGDPAAVRAEANSLAQVPLAPSRCGGACRKGGPRGSIRV